MHYVQGDAAKEALMWMHGAAKVASGALCLKAKCGTVIVKDGRIIGQGYNAPPRDNINERRCLTTYDLPGKPNYDRTCCMHAEWRAIHDALRHHPDHLLGSRLFFTRIDDVGNIKKSGVPYCTVCSRLALDAGIAEFFLWHKEGISAYSTDEYNALSYSYVDQTKFDE